LEIADRYCREIDFFLYGKKQTVIGFKNNAGGYELRSKNFKGSSSPKDVTFIDIRTDDVAVFEGFPYFTIFVIEFTESCVNGCKEIFKRLHLYKICRGRINSAVKN
jgi:hypothetical protein